jgi:hypothetical protein
LNILDLGVEHQWRSQDKAAAVMPSTNGLPRLARSGKFNNTEHAQFSGMK